jgi:uncharacterized coiled-coil protein SlyX
MEEINSKYDILTKHVIILYNKLSEGDQLYKKWCRKTDQIIKSIHLKFHTQDDVISELNNTISGLELRLHKSNKLVIFLVNRIKKEKQKSYYDIIINQFDKINIYCYIISLILILFFIIIYYI